MIINILLKNLPFLNRKIFKNLQTFAKKIAKNLHFVPLY